MVEIDPAVVAAARAMGFTAAGRVALTIADAADFVRLNALAAAEGSSGAAQGASAGAASPFITSPVTSSEA